MSDLIIIGGSGHAEVLADIALKNGYTIAGFLDDNEKTTEVLGFKVLGKVSDCLKYKNEYLSENDMLGHTFVVDD